MPLASGCQFHSFTNISANSVQGFNIPLPGKRFTTSGSGRETSIISEYSCTYVRETSTESAKQYGPLFSIARDIFSILSPIGGAQLSFISDSTMASSFLVVD